MNRSNWWLVESRAGWAIIGAGVAAAVAGGIWMDAATDLDPRAFLLGGTALGALLAMVFTARQASVARWHTDSVLTPHLIIERLDPRTKGLQAEVRNHGGGLAAGVTYDAVLIRGAFDPTDLANLDLASRTDAVASRIGATFVSIGAGMSVRRMLIPWDSVPDGFDSDEVWSVMARFFFTSPTGRRRENPHSTSFAIGSDGR